MIKTEHLATASAPDGKLMSLYRRQDVYSIRVGGVELMTTNQSYSEERLGELVCDKWSGNDTEILIGGLGFGFTLGAVLKSISKSSRVVVAELMESVIMWNSNKEYQLCHRLMSDSRTFIRQKDVMDVIKEKPGNFHGIILDVDNGPEALTTGGNQNLYSLDGLMTIRGALKKRGVLGVWSADNSQQFQKMMRKAGFDVEVHKVRSRGHKGSLYHLFIGQLK